MVPIEPRSFFFFCLRSSCGAPFRLSAVHISCARRLSTFFARYFSTLPLHAWIYLLVAIAAATAAAVTSYLDFLWIFVSSASAKCVVNRISALILHFVHMADIRIINSTV
ncbi:unnamed protein product [Ceratitis capitata]|uniref:(Mediterranean fruit fly) hypothetical protein n=1 Tax=Ceratitis capitata TaxID=7213 RepID=A0A811UTB3_CERCA|nr:unnamed protein product [Ceratitis capitata]